LYQTIILLKKEEYMNIYGYISFIIIYIYIYVYIYLYIFLHKKFFTGSLLEFCIIKYVIGCNVHVGQVFFYEQNIKKAKIFTRS